MKPTPVRTSLKRRHRIRKAILQWYQTWGRELPWRKTRNPYRILISEILLQQTQVHRVLQKYPQFLKKFPDLSALARGRRRDVILAWRGMGYNSRAVRLHLLARQVVEKHHGKLPSSYKELIQLPGVGKYTANALLSSGWRKNAAVVDINVRRVFSRILFSMKTTADLIPEEMSWNIAEDLVPRGNAYTWNQALMDLGATICTKSTPKCDSCPVGAFCFSRKHMRSIRVHLSRSEPSYKGIPNRIHRGKIVEELRRLNGRRAIPSETLGKRVLTGYTSRNEKWLKGILAGLEKDGLVKSNGKNGERISLA